MSSDAVIGVTANVASLTTGPRPGCCKRAVVVIGAQRDDDSQRVLASPPRERAARQSGRDAASDLTERPQLLELVDDQYELLAVGHEIRRDGRAARPAPAVGADRVAVGGRRNAS